MAFVSIDLERYTDLHLRVNPSENRDDLRARLRDALEAKDAGRTCRCGNPIWAIGSAIVGYSCFTCITGEAMPDDDYEIYEAADDRPARGAARAGKRRGRSRRRR